MNRSVVLAVAAQASRIALRRAALALAADCAHDMRPLPVVDFRIDEQCARCGGLVTTPA